MLTTIISLASACYIKKKSGLITILIIRNWWFKFRKCHFLVWGTSLSGGSILASDPELLREIWASKASGASLVAQPDQDFWKLRFKCYIKGTPSIGDLLNTQLMSLLLSGSHLSTTERESYHFFTWHCEAGETMGHLKSVLTFGMYFS